MAGSQMISMQNSFPVSASWQAACDSISNIHQCPQYAEHSSHSTQQPIVQQRLTFMYPCPPSMQTLSAVSVPPACMPQQQVLQTARRPKNVQMASIHVRKNAPVRAAVIPNRSTKLNLQQKAPRTRPCKYWPSPSGCFRGGQCPYAHGEAQV